MGLSKIYLNLFCAIIALLGLALTAIIAGVLIYPITRPIPAWYVYLAGFALSISLLIFAALGISRSSTIKAYREGISSVLFIAIIYAALTTFAGLWLSSWAADFFEVARNGIDSTKLSKAAISIITEVEKDFTGVYVNAGCHFGGQMTRNFDGKFSKVQCDHELTQKALNAVATTPQPAKESGREYLMCLSFPRQQANNVKGVTGLWCRTGQAMVNNIAAITLWSAVIMFVVALLFLLAAAATWRQKRKGIREQMPRGFGETAPLMVPGARVVYA
ncbi:hypothetical protein Pmar_PMAR000619 [Perkinsus marinus ATCC 50983]|uniref:Uncharacterized protein n=1 Tax=Perkinsus marinus (strain ATCC 50983 / TXsc) TaxID=423536 RepID=C5LVJ8_PERM5|nr:hypothetical protein Pmar_PMAR000619 [Perkinsus marinus ATCC 50983]EEQ99246.1 hypothetical protein Pmar_PMAR000619 [Perkinsus marinus ATCC 50983]|eukprot:XP_002766529.1 hypothetical protein Pmar_PMAR000619 [Perkinsus marinus ATCC 50983]